jgi:hypothetical protein
MKRAVFMAVVAAAVIGAACSEERATLSDPIVEDAFGFGLQLNATNMPTSSSARFVFKRTPADVTPESVTVTLRGLDSLTSGFYTVWIGDSLGTSFKRAAGALSVVRTDTTFNEDGAPVPAPTTIDLGTVSSFQNGSPREVFTLAITRGTAGLAVSDSIQTLLITIEETADASTPSATRRPFWARRGEGVAGPATGTAFRTSALRFGNWGPLASDQYLYVPAMRGRGAFQGQVLTVNDSSMARPPVGYFYAMYAITAPTATTPGDTLYLGEQRSPWPNRDLSQFDADVSITDPAVVLDVPPSILAGSVRVSGDTLGLPATFPYKGVTEVLVMLEPKTGIRGRMGVMRIANAFAPGVITSGAR